MTDVGGLKKKRAYVLSQGNYDPSKYENDFSFKPWDGNDPLGVHTTVEMLECLDRFPGIGLDARVLGLKESQLVQKNISAKQFKESYLSNHWDQFNFRENDCFGSGGFQGGGFAGTVGHDFIPLLGGPFYKNLYYYQDYIRMAGEAFYAWNNDPFARAITQITRDFVIGTGYEMQCDTSTPQGKAAMAAWKSFEEVNDFQEQVDLFTIETSIYGESMLWELPNNQTKITYQLPNSQIPTGIIPRVRIIDPTNIVEIVTYPEDISRVLMYVWLVPTQYQIYTGGIGSNSGVNVTGDPVQPTLKFIYRQIPADQMYHFKINTVSGEKRGRSDYFPIFPYLKRMRDSIDYAMIGQLKASAWSIDTMVDGDQTDIDAYVASQQSEGTIANAGSEHVHSKAIQRQYLGNTAHGGNVSNSFEWNLSMIAAGSGIPISYYGTHLSGGSTRASALVATEPVAKKMEKRREVLKRMLNKMWKLVMTRAGLPLIDCDIVFPEIITQDRSQKLKDLALCETQEWFKPERVASMAAKEMHVDNFSYAEEMKDAQQQFSDLPHPLTAPGSAGQPPQQSSSGSPNFNPADSDTESALTSQDKRTIKLHDRTL